MDAIWNFIQQNLNYILITIGVILVYLAGRTRSIGAAISQVWEVVTIVALFFADAIKEQDGNGGKTSFSRILGIYVTLQIVAMSWVTLLNPNYAIPAEMMTLFWVTIGYALISKVFTAASPLLQQLIAAYLVKVQQLPKTEDDVK